MSKITECLENMRRTGKKGLIPFITAGDPDLAGTVEIAKRLAFAGADLVELGIPFSDPVADGPVIQQASGRALKSGTTLQGILEAVREIKKDCSMPLILMGYYNQIYKYGLRRFTCDAAKAGVSGLIVPDLPHEECGPLREEAILAGLDLIPLVAPTTTNPRLEKITAGACGFIYCVSVTGVTGTREQMGTDLENFTGRVRRYTSLPLAVGFGIAGPEQAAQTAKLCDAVVVGSAIVKIIAEYNDVSSAGPAVEKLVSQIRGTLDGLQYTRPK
ncbi:MAG: tryptophan synthase subunit alpha [Desulfotomaculaceae bacterium]|nr:tryptophan synthase subunit alpha [Desulfotomaculaceae bacterium]